MKTSEDVFQLIKSLNKTEKRYFKLYASLQKGDKGYLQLFDAIEKQVVYDEERILAKFKQERFTNNFSVVKAYLYQSVLKSMRLYSSSASVQILLREMIADIQFLFERGLFKQAGKLIEKAKQMAYKYEYHLVLLEIISQETLLLRTRYHLVKTEVEIEKLNEESARVMEKHKEINHYLSLASKIVIWVNKKGHARKQSEVQKYGQHIKEMLREVEKTTLSYKANLIFYFSCIAGLDSIGDYEAAYAGSAKILKIMEAHPHQIEEKPVPYVRALHNFGLCQMRLNNFKEASHTITKMQRLHFRSPKVAADVFILMSILELTLLARTGNFGEGLQAIPKIEKKLKGLGLPSALEKYDIQFNYSFAYICFGAKQYSLSKKYLNKIVNDPQKNYAHDLQSLARILSLIIYFESGDQDMVQYFEKSTSRFLKRKEQLFRTEQLLLHFIRKEDAGSFAKSDLISKFKKLLSELRKIVEDPLENSVLMNLNVIAWVESKIHGKTFADVVKVKLVAST